MARIPDVSDLGARPVVQFQQPRTIDQSGAILGQSLESAGNTAMRIADEQYAQRVNLARAKASNALLDNEIAVRAKVDDIQQRVQTGELHYDQALSTFQNEAAQLQQPQISGLDKLGTLTLQKGMARNVFSGQSALDHFVKTARQNDFKDQFSGALDKLGKLAGMPGADIDAINAKADAYAPMAREAGLPPSVVDNAIQTFKDRNWFNNAVQVAMESANSRDDLRQLKHDLTAADGFYAGKLDTEKRNAVLQTVLTHEQQLDARQQHLADRQDAKAQRALYAIDQQIASGVPATAQMWSDWESAVKGSSYEDEFKQRMSDEREVQGILRKPIGDQITYVQQKTQELDTGGGTARDRANLARLSASVRANVQQLQTAPLLFAQNRTGVQAQPLDLETLGTPDGDRQISAQIANRATSLTAMRKDFGAQVPMRPLLPQEVDQLSQVLTKGTPRQQAEVFGSLKNVISDPDAYRGAMQQIAPDHPVIALAGMMAGKDTMLTLATHWFRPDQAVSSKDVAMTMLEGERMLDATKEQKAQDGKPKTGLYLPNDESLQVAFQNGVGAAFAGRSDAAQTAYQAVKAYYTGKAAQTGRLASTKGDIDSDLVTESIGAVLGGVSNFNGNGEVLMPWGMASDQFEDRVRSSLISELKRRKIPEDVADTDYGLRNQGDGSYYVTSGRNFVLDGKGSPLVIRVAP